MFPDNFSEKDQDAFLRSIGIDENVQGSEEALADNLGPAFLIEKIGVYQGVAILAHADVNKGFLQSLCNSRPNQGELSFNGKSLAKIVKCSDLLGVQCNNDKNRIVLRSKLDNVDFKRESGPLAFIKCSDCHGLLVNGSKRYLVR